MSRSNGHRPHRHPADCQPAGLRAALALLLEEYDYARKLRLAPGDFPVRVQTLSAVGLAPNELRMLVLKGYVAGDTDRRASGRPLRLSAAAELVLTPAGVAFARGACVSQARYGLRQRRARPLVPRYDFLLRTLWVRRRVVKRLKQVAPDQEAVLSAFQRQRWARRIADPLPKEPGQDPQQHLHDTIKNLNRHQLCPLIHFYGDGTGRGVCWELRRNGARKPKGGGTPHAENIKAGPTKEASGPVHGNGNGNAGSGIVPRSG